VRILLWIGLLLLLLGGIVSPAMYLYTASTLPPLENEFDLERHLRNYVESGRMSLQLGMAAKGRGGVAYTRPDFAKLPKDLVAFYIDGWDCPSFFQTPRETGFAWTWRVFSSWAFNRQPPGDGRCEWLLANQLAYAIHIRGGLRQSIAASKLHAFLSKDQLVAYDLTSIVFDQAVVGVDDASHELFKKPLDALTLPELAELELTLPPNGFYPEMRQCRSPSQLRHARDFVLGQLSRHGLIPEDRARGAQAAPVSCTRP
jgi:hypothetical protein